MVPQPLAHRSVESSQPSSTHADSDLPGAVPWLTKCTQSSSGECVWSDGATWSQFEDLESIRRAQRSGTGLLGSGHLSENLADLICPRAFRIQLEGTLKMYFGLSPVLSFLVNKAKVKLVGNVAGGFFRSFFQQVSR